MSFAEPSGGEAIIVATGDVATKIYALQSSDAFVLELEFLNSDMSPWVGAPLLGTVGGCGHWVGDRPRHMGVRTDIQGRYFAAIADLLLRSNGVHALRVIGTMPEQFITGLQTFALVNGYRIIDSADALGEPESCSRRSNLSNLADRVHPSHTALILIDIQNDFCAPSGATGRLAQSMMMIKSAVERSKLLLEAGRQAGLFVVHVRAEYGESFRGPGSPYRYLVDGYREPAVWTASAADLEVAQVPTGAAEVCVPGSWGAEFVSGFEPTRAEAIITKHRFSAFIDTGLDPLLRANGIRSVVLAGVTTNCCVESTAREAVMRDYRLVVASDCVAVKDHLKDLHDATLESLSLYFGLVRSSAEIMVAWSAARQQAVS